VVQLRFPALLEIAFFVGNERTVRGKGTRGFYLQSVLELSADVQIIFRLSLYCAFSLFFFFHELRAAARLSRCFAQVYSFGT
jgi:hypothetical protein